MSGVGLNLCEKLLVQEAVRLTKTCPASAAMATFQSPVGGGRTKDPSANWAPPVVRDPRKEVDEPEPVTHTGQRYGDDDWRQDRFTLGLGRKEVNENFPIFLAHEVPAKRVTERVAACDGGRGPLGHPKVYINLDEPGEHACGYCGQSYYLDESCRSHPET